MSRATAITATKIKPAFLSLMLTPPETTNPTEIELWGTSSPISFLLMFGYFPGSLPSGPIDDARVANLNTHEFVLCDFTVSRRLINKQFRTTILAGKYPFVAQCKLISSSQLQYSNVELKDSI